MDKYRVGYTEKQTPDYAAEISLKTTETRTVVEVDLTGDANISIHADSESKLGDELIIKASSDGTARTITFGDGITAPDLAGAINKTKVAHLVHDGEGFVQVGTAVQID